MTALIAYRETIVDGLANAPDAFMGLFWGDNMGKQLVRVTPPRTCGSNGDRR